MNNTIQQNLIQIQHKIQRACQKSNRPLEQVKLIAVSKFHANEEILNAFQAGQILFGENRVQELVTKVHTLPEEIEWHLIGHLQSNKVAKAVSVAHWIHSVDSCNIAEKIIQSAEAQNKKINILIEVNISGETQKEGSSPLDVYKIASLLLQSKYISLQGLMTMAPFDASPNELHQIFSKLRHLRNNLEQQTGHVFPHLSMGMSNDFEIAIEEGATFVRVGTAIFGPRTI